MTEEGGLIFPLTAAEAKQIRQITDKAWRADEQRKGPTRRFIPLVQEKGVYNILVKEPNSVADAGANEAENGGSRSGAVTAASHQRTPAVAVQTRSLAGTVPAVRRRGAAGSLRRKAGASRTTTTG
eukprot:2081178-Amphidinium_carterae.1